jgi:hypothetical protein
VALAAAASMREHIIGVRVSETNARGEDRDDDGDREFAEDSPDQARHEDQRQKTAASEIVIDRIVKLICLALWMDAFSAFAMLHAADGVFQKDNRVIDQKPIASVSAISERLSRLYPSICMTMNVSSSDRGSATAGISVSVARPRKRRSPSRPARKRSAASADVVRGIDDRERAIVNRRQMDGGGQLGCMMGSKSRTLLATSTALEPGLAEDGQHDHRRRNVVSRTQKCMRMRSS